MQRTLRPGDALPIETDLARQFAVNRSTVREALRRLESNGLIGRTAGGKKLLVIRPALADTVLRVSRALALDDVTFIELWQAILAIAPPTAALAAEHADVEGKAQLRRVLLPRGGEPVSAETAGTCVVEFFRILAEQSKNRVLLYANEPLTRLLVPSLRRMIDRVPQARGRIATAQHRIADAIERGDAADAQSWMTRHVRDFRSGYEVAGIALDTRVG